MHSSFARRAKVKHKNHSSITPEANALRHLFPRPGADRPGLGAGSVGAEPKTNAGKSCEARQGPRRSDAQDGTKGFRALPPAVVQARGIQDRSPYPGRTRRRRYDRQPLAAKRPGKTLRRGSERITDRNVARPDSGRPDDTRSGAGANQPGLDRRVHRPPGYGLPEVTDRSEASAGNYDPNFP